MRPIAAVTFGRSNSMAFAALTLALVLGCGLSPAEASVSFGFSAQTGEVRDLAAVNSNTMFAATQGGGLWKSADSGVTWNKVAGMPARYVWKVAIPGGATATVFAATSVGLFKSTDSGVTWNQLTRDYARALAVDSTGNTVMLGVPGAGILRSTDGGATFVDVSAGLDSVDVRAIVLDASGNAYAALYSNLAGGGWGGVFRLASGGTTWASWNAAGSGGGNALGSLYVTGLAINSTALLAATSNGTGDGAGRIYRNTLTGPGWNNPTTPPTGDLFDVEAVALDRSDATGQSFVAGSRAIGIYRSTDNGVNWSSKSSGVPNAELGGTMFAIGTFAGSNAAVAAPRGAGLFYTANITAGSPTWLPASGVAADRVLSLANHAIAAPNTYYIGLNGGGVKKSTNAGGAWASLLSGLSNGGPDPVLGTATAIAANPNDATSVFVALRTTGLYKLNGSLTAWITDPGAPSILMPQNLQFDGSGNLYYTMFNSGGIYKRTSGGSWGLIEPSVWPGGAGAQGLFQNSNGSFIATMFDELPQRSASGTAGTWSTVAVSPAGPNDTGFMRIAFTSITEKPGSGGTILLGSTNRGLYASNNGGSNWFRVATSGPATMHTALSAVQYGAATSPLWAADRSGSVYCSTNDGGTWVSAGQAGAPVIALKYMNGQMHALTDGAGVAKIAATCP
jgi:hypothetical protein